MVDKTVNGRFLSTADSKWSTCSTAEEMTECSVIHSRLSITTLTCMLNGDTHTTPLYQCVCSVNGFHTQTPLTLFRRKNGKALVTSADVPHRLNTLLMTANICVQPIHFLSNNRVGKLSYAALNIMQSFPHNMFRIYPCLVLVFCLLLSAAMRDQCSDNYVSVSKISHESVNIFLYIYSWLAFESTIQDGCN